MIHETIYPTQITGKHRFLVFKRGDSFDYRPISSIDFNDRGAWIRTCNDTASDFREYDEKVTVSS